MRNFKTVIGSNFGDEGKGIMTDYFCQNIKSRSLLNVRFNGGAQAGHTVCHVDGRRHVFHHIGSGSFNSNVITYLASPFVLNPMLFEKEMIELSKKGVVPKVFVSKDCIVTLPSDILINQILEEHRGNNRHGSCGVGVWETVIRNRDYSKLTLETMIRLLENGRIYDVLSIINDNYTFKRLIEAGTNISNLCKDKLELLTNKNILDNFIDSLEYMLKNIEIVNDTILLDYDNVVFEGAQGLLLDWDNREYFPNITASYTGMKNVTNLLSDIDNYNLEICYVTRSYFTRHGAGKFTSECDKDVINTDMVDKTNFTNEFQGSFRYGYFDKELFNKTIAKDSIYWPRRNEKISIAITHLDETDDMIRCENGGIFPEAVGIYTSNLYKSYSEIANKIIVNSYD